MLVRGENFGNPRFLRKLIGYAPFLVIIFSFKNFAHLFSYAFLKPAFLQNALCFRDNEISIILFFVMSFIRIGAIEQSVKMRDRFFSFCARFPLKFMSATLHCAGFGGKKFVLQPLPVIKKIYYRLNNAVIARFVHF